MPREPCVTTLLGNQHGKGTKTLLKSSRQYFRHIFWSLWKKMSSKSSVLVVCEILRLFVNILKPNEKYSLSVKARVSRNQFKSNYLKSKNIFRIFFFFSETYIKFSILWKKIWASEVIFFWNIDCKIRGYFHD